MPTNLTPEYRRVEAAYRKARDPSERLDLLRQMLRVMPKHKGTDHLQAEIKSRIKQLSEEAAAPRKQRRGGPTHVVRPEGAAQIALVGPPNSGKSALHERLCGSHATVGPYPFSTTEPLPGMLPFEDVQIQLVDLPPVSREHPLPWLYNALQPADGCLLVVDLSADDCVDACRETIEALDGWRVRLTPEWGPTPPAESTGDEEPDPFRLTLPALLLAAKADLLDEPAAEVEVFFELLGREFPWRAASVESGEGLDSLGGWLFKALGVVRAYTKTPGKPADMTRPVILRRGDTMRQVGRDLHKELGAGMRFARVWGSETFDGQQV
ncbi:MAG: GTPase, partial [Dehalococcoidia bacterium]